MIAPKEGEEEEVVKEGKGEYGLIWGEKEGNANYGGMVQPNQQHVAPCVKVVEWGFRTKGLGMFAAFWSASRYNKYVDNFISSLDKFYCRCFPIKVKYISNSQAFNPWINSNLRKFISYKSQYFHLFWLGIVTKEENKIYRNKVQSIIKKCKINYYNAVFF